LRSVETGIDGPAQVIDVMDIRALGDLADIANLGLTLSETKQILARLQQVVVGVQADDHAGLRPDCPSCGGACHAKDWRLHRMATLFGMTAVWLPRFRGADCGHGETGIRWRSYRRSTPELDRLRAHVSAWVAGETYANGPVILGLMYEDNSQGDARLAGYSQRHETGLAFGGNCTVAPGLQLVAEYQYETRHQGGFDFNQGTLGF
jgi:hypothetical protein